MNKELEKLQKWLCINRLSLNITKKNVVIFHSINKPKVPVTINKEAIDEVKRQISCRNRFSVNISITSKS